MLAVRARDGVLPPGGVWQRRPACFNYTTTRSFTGRLSSCCTLLSGARSIAVQVLLGRKVRLSPHLPAAIAFGHHCANSMRRRLLQWRAVRFFSAYAKVTTDYLGDVPAMSAREPRKEISFGAVDPTSTDGTCTHGTGREAPSGAPGGEA